MSNELRTYNPARGGGISAKFAQIPMIGLCCLVLILALGFIPGVARAQDETLAPPPEPLNLCGTAAGTMEIDGDLASDGLFDWYLGTGGFGIFSGTTPTAILPLAFFAQDGNWGNASVAPDTAVFAGTSNKNGDLIGAGQKPWTYKPGDSGYPQKNDITECGVWSFTSGTDR